MNTSLCRKQRSLSSLGSITALIRMGYGRALACLPGPCLPVIWYFRSWSSDRECGSLGVIDVSWLAIARYQVDKVET